MRRWPPCLILAAGCLFAAGCGGPYKTYPAEGTVALPDGTPLAGLRVTFVSEQPAVSATGITDGDGHFVLGTIEADDGAPAGVYEVVVVEAARADLPPPSRIHARYARLETSGLQFTVEPQRNEFTLQLDPAAPSRP